MRGTTPHFIPTSLTKDVMEGMVGVDVEGGELMPLHHSYVVYMTRVGTSVYIICGGVSGIGKSFKRYRECDLRLRLHLYPRNT